MIPVKQNIFNKDIGDCFRACMASILEIPNSNNIPNIDQKKWLNNWMNWLEVRGMRLGMDHEAIWKDGYWIATVPSLNLRDTTHAIVMFGGKVAFDPSTHKKYRKGTNLFCKNIVSFGHWIEISDMTKLKNYLESQ